VNIDSNEILILNECMFSRIFISFAIIICALFFHAHNITTVPEGLYLDETSIGINAGNIALSGVDEYEKNFPIYFEAFGEWKNPLYIYVSAGVMKLFGISDFTLRTTSVLFFGIFLFGLYLFTSLVFRNKKHRNILVYFALISASCTPWFFTISRIAFEVISQIATGIFILYFAYKYYVMNSSHFTGVWLGISLGLFLYSYSTSKLIVFGILLSLFINFFEKKYWKKHTVVSLVFIVLLLPYIYFSYTHSGALSARFELLTYLYNTDLSLLEKLGMFLKNYFSSYDISSFLLFEGDKNVRHSSGFMGQIFFVTFVLFIIGVSKIISDIVTKQVKKQTDKNIGKNISENNIENKYKLFLLLLLVGAPIAASLTTDTHHSLRLLFFGFMLFVFSLYGANCIFKKYSNHFGRIIVFIILLTATLIQSYFYFSDYFDKKNGYASRAIQWFDGNKFEEHAQIAMFSSLSKVVYLFENTHNPFYANVDFYNLKQLNEKKVTMTKKHSVIFNSECVIVPQKNIQEFRLQYKKKINEMQIQLTTDLFTTYCYQ